MLYVLLVLMLLCLVLVVKILLLVNKIKLYQYTNNLKMLGFIKKELLKKGGTKKYDTRDKIQKEL